MHVLLVREELVKKHPWLASNIAHAFNEAKRLAYERVRNPRVVPLAWFTHEWEEQVAILGHDPWAYGLDEANRKNLGDVDSLCSGARTYRESGSNRRLVYRREQGSANWADRFLALGRCKANAPHLP